MGVESFTQFALFLNNRYTLTSNMNKIDPEHNFLWKISFSDKTDILILDTTIGLSRKRFNKLLFEIKYVVINPFST